MSSQPKVFVTQERVGTDYSPALKFGTVHFLTVAEYQCEPTSGVTNGNIKSDITRKMADYIPGHDYILVGGSPISVLLTGILMAKHKDTKHKILKWNNRKMQYDLVVV